MNLNRPPRRYSGLRLFFYRLFTRAFAFGGIGRRLYARHLKHGAFDVTIQPHECYDREKCLRVAHLSDFHAGPFLDSRSLAAVVRAVNDLEPHVIVLTGDYISHGPEDADLLCPALSELEASHSIFAVFGNHDYRYRMESYLVNRFSEIGVEVLRNTARAVLFKGKRIWFLGIEDIEEGKHPDLDGTLQAIDEAEYRVLLSHNPEVVRGLGSAQIDLVLSGHTHGGQVNLPLLGSFGTGYQGGFRAGLHLHGDTRLYVNRGLGCLVLPTRIGANAEVTLHLLKG